MSSEMEKAGLPVSFSSTKVVKKSTEKNRKKKAQKRKNKNKNKIAEDYERYAEEFVDHFNYAEEFKIEEVLKEYRNPFTILMPKAERFKSEDDEENYDDCEYEEPRNFQENCDLDYGFESADQTSEGVAEVVGTDDSENNTTKQQPALQSPASKSKKKGDPLHKYYQQRYDYFSLFDSGIQIDEEGWYSVTPEIIADHIAKEAHSIALTNKTEPGSTVILDAFCGVGGNTIQFAKYFDRVIAVDLDAGRLEMARHNATIYDVVDRITFIHGDVFKVLPELTDEGVDLVFMSPPWGGPDYVSRPVFCPRADLLDKRGDELFKLGRLISKNLILFLPRQTDIFAISEMAKNENGIVAEDDSFVVEQHWLRNRLKAISIYFY